MGFPRSFYVSAYHSVSAVFAVQNAVIMIFQRIIVPDMGKRIILYNFLNTVKDFLGNNGFVPAAA